MRSRIGHRALEEIGRLVLELEMRLRRGQREAKRVSRDLRQGRNAR